MSSKYSKMKVFHYRDKMDSLLPEDSEISAPLYIRIKPTNVCNHNCKYCAYKVNTLQVGQDMGEKDYIPKEKMLEIIDDIAEIGVKAVTFSGGGDPFVYPYLRDAVRRLSKTSVKFAALTNGARLDGETAEMFAHSGQWLRVSIDGWDDDSYSFYRGTRGGEFAKVMRNMENFKKMNGKCHLGVSLIVDKDNGHHIFDFVKRIKDIGADSIKISPCIISNDGASNNAYHKEIFGIVKKQVSEAILEIAADEFEIYDAYHELNEKFDKDYEWCPFIQILPVIGADLNVYSCQDKAYNLDEGLLGSIKNIRFKDFWFSDKSRFFKINPSQVCNHHCIANSKNKLILEYLEVDTEHLPFV